MAAVGSMKKQYGLFGVETVSKDCCNNICLIYCAVPEVARAWWLVILHKAPLNPQRKPLA